MTPAQAEAKRQAEVMIAFSEGKEIEVSDIGSFNWHNSANPKWDWACFNYRIAAPKPKRVKFLCWFHTPSDCLVWYEENSAGAHLNLCKRVPELDREVEVVEP